jgi:hypothetical protein
MALHGGVIVGGDIYYIRTTFNSAPLTSHDTMWERTLDHLPFLPESRVLALISCRGRAKESTVTTTCVRALPRDLQGHGAPCGEVVRRDAPTVVQIIVLVDVHLVAVRYGSDGGALASALRWLAK